MKLYVLKDSKNRVFAISESKKILDSFYRQIYMFNKNMSIKIIENEKKINRYLIDYDEYYLAEYCGYIVRIIDAAIFKSIIKDEKNKIQATIDTLIEMTENYNVSNAEYEAFDNLISLLKTNSKNKRIKKFIDIEGFINSYYCNACMRDYLIESYMVYNVNK